MATLLERLEAEARAENPDVAAEYASPSSREASPRPPASASDSAEVSTAEPVASTSSAPATTALNGDAHDVPAAIDTTAAPVATVPVKKKRPLPASPPPKKPRKPQPTIRLEIDLSAQLEQQPADGVYEVNYEETAREKGLRVIQSESEHEESSTDGSDDDGDEDAPAQPSISGTTAALLGGAPIVAKGTKRKRKKVIQDRDEGYDTSDSFVDDSDLRLDMPKFYVRPRRDGFYVATGSLDLLQLSKAKATRKPASTTTKKPSSTEEPPAKKARKVPLTTIGTPIASTSKANGHRDGTSATPIPVDSETDSKKPLGGGAIAFSAASNKGTPSKKAAPVEGPPSVDRLTPELQKMVKDLKAQVANTSFEPKNKFPLSLKPPLQALAFKAIEQSHYDDHFFKLLPTIFPYNEFTMKDVTQKLTKREIYPKRMEDMREHQDRLIGQFAGCVNGQLPASEAQFAKDVEAYEVKLAKWKETQAANTGSAMNVDISTTEPPVSKGKNRAPPEPVKKLLFTDDMTRMFYEIMIIEDEMVKLQNEKLELDKSEADRPSNLAARKQLYQRLLSLFPSEWMTTNLLSRRWSAAKTKYGGGGDDEE